MWQQLLYAFKRPTSKKLLFSLYIPAILVLGVTAMASYIADISIDNFTRDPLAIYHGNALFGALSNLGAIIWSCATAVAFFSFFLVWDRTGLHKKSIFLFAGGVVSTVLLLDDLYMVHERVVPRLFHIRDDIILIGYGVMLIVYGLTFYSLILQENITLLALFAIFLFISFAIDLVPEGRLPWHHLFEDGSKFLAIVAWAGYQFENGFREIKRAYTT